MKNILSLSLIGLLVVANASHLAKAALPPPSISSDFFSVLRSGDERRLREALDRGAPINARDAAGNTPLMLAAAYADVACVKLLLDRGAEVNVANQAGATPLMRAAHDFNKLRLLLDRGAPVNERSGFGNTALMLAARPAESRLAVELLLAHGADARATNNFGSTALMSACAGGDLESVRRLLQRGGAVNTPAAMDVNNFVFGGGRTPLMWAAFRADLPLMKLLLKAGADIEEEGFLGTPLSQAVLSGDARAVKLLVDTGADLNHVAKMTGYAPLHWAASAEDGHPALVDLLLKHGSDPNLGGGLEVEAFMDVPQTPLMLARRRGETPIFTALTKGGATEETADLLPEITPVSRWLPERPDTDVLRGAIGAAVPLLQSSAIDSKKAFVNHESRQDCTSCHQQYLPLAAIGAAKKSRVLVDGAAEQQLIEMIRSGEVKTTELDWQALFHPDAVQTKGYTLFGYSHDELPAEELTDAAVFNLAVLQAADGRWLNNLPRPPLQTGDVGATALAIHALQRYPLPGRKAELAQRVERARRWLWIVKPTDTDSRIYQLLGLAWAGESAEKLKPLAKALLAEQRADGGWAQLPGLAPDAYATGQAVYALRVGAGLPASQPELQQGVRYLLQTQLADGTWYVRRRAYPFQPTMKSGFPHGRDSWISAAGTSWAVLALGACDQTELATRSR